MDPVTGALIATGVAWLSIWIAISLPEVKRRKPHPKHVRLVGAATIALFALQVLGLPVPIWAPLAVLGGGLVIAIVVAPRGYAAAA